MHMEGKLLADSLVSLTGQNLRLVFALLCKTNIGNLLSAKTKDFISRTDEDHFTKHLMQEVNKLEHIDDVTIQLDLFLELCKLLKIKGTKYNLPIEIEQQCTEIINRTYEQYEKSDKNFKLFASKQTESTKLQQMIQHQMNQMFMQFDKNYTEFSFEDQEKFAATVHEYICSLPQEKQQLIKDKLGVQDLSDEVMNQLLKSSGISIIFAVLVEVCGFAFYTTATSLVAGLVGLIGITLPFGFYTGLTSFIAVLSSPFFLIPMLLGGGAVLIHQQNKSLRNKLIPIVLVQLVLPYMSEASQAADYTPFIEKWTEVYKQYEVLHSQLNVTEHKKQLAQQQKNQLSSQIKSLSQQQAALEKEVQQLRLHIRQTVTEVNVREIQVSDKFTELVARRDAARLKIYELERQKQQKLEEHQIKGLFNYAWRKMTTTLDLSEQKTKLNKLYDQMTDEVIRAKSSFKQDTVNEIYRKQENIALLKIEKSKCEKEKQQVENRHLRLYQTLGKLQGEIKEYEQRYYGLQHLYIHKTLELGGGQHEY